jgi:glycosyltransferase involved in cell wall biosynthesis
MRNKMKTYKVGIIGFFAKRKSKAGGQEAKTCSIDRAMKEKYGFDAVYNVDTTDWKKNPFKLFWGIVIMSMKCENIVMLPAQNSIKVFIPIFDVLNKVFHRKLFYSVVGGWLPEHLKGNPRLQEKCKKLNGIFVETKSMQQALVEMGFCNVSVVPNFKYLKPVQTVNVNVSLDMPYRLCTFSRVMKEKGIEDIVKAVQQINNQFGKTIFALDIYGKIDDAYIVRFEELRKSFPDYIKYAGMVEPEQSVETIKDYFALVFPTHYFTEGVPGTLVDACMAGIPVISALWGNYEDVFVEGVTGWGYEFGNQEALIEVLIRVMNNPKSFSKLRHSTLKEAAKYLPNANIELITKQFA